jgi:hypothetical protein
MQCLDALTVALRTELARNRYPPTDMHMGRQRAKRAVAVALRFPFTPLPSLHPTLLWILS